MPATSQSTNFYSDRGIMLFNGQTVIEPADFNRIEFTLVGNFVMEDGMTTDGSTAGFTNKNRSATINTTIKIANNKAFPNLFDQSLYTGNIVQIHVLGARNLVTGDYTGNNVLFTNCKFIGTGQSGYSGVGKAGTISLDFESTDYQWVPLG